MKRKGEKKEGGEHKRGENRPGTCSEAVDKMAGQDHGTLRNRIYARTT